MNKNKSFCFKLLFRNGGNGGALPNKVATGKKSSGLCLTLFWGLIIKGYSTASC